MKPQTQQQLMSELENTRLELKHYRQLAQNQATELEFLRARVAFVLMLAKHAANGETSLAPSGEDVASQEAA